MKFRLGIYRTNLNGEFRIYQKDKTIILHNRIQRPKDLNEGPITYKKIINVSLRREKGPFYLCNFVN